VSWRERERERDRESSPCFLWFDYLPWTTHGIENVLLTFLTFIQCLRTVCHHCLLHLLFVYTIYSVVQYLDTIYYQYVDTFPKLYVHLLKTHTTFRHCPGTCHTIKMKKVTEKTAQYFGDPSATFTRRKRVCAWLRLNVQKWCVFLILQPGIKYSLFL
jgi:hypothetical protein